MLLEKKKLTLQQKFVVYDNSKNNWIIHLPFIWIWSTKYTQWAIELHLILFYFQNFNGNLWKFLMWFNFCNSILTSFDNLTQIKSKMTKMIKNYVVSPSVRGDLSMINILRLSYFGHCIFKINILFVTISLLWPNNE